MLVDIPDPAAILTTITAFILGLGAVIVYNVLKPRLKIGLKDTKIIDERLEYYENLLIDMKIRLDSLEMTPINEENIQAHIPRPKEQKIQEESPSQIKQERIKEKVQNTPSGNVVDYVLQLITERPMTSRDIQITIGRTREHTSRMLKKLFEEGLVERDMSTKPFSYKITDKGLNKTNVIQVAPAQ